VAGMGRSGAEKLPRRPPKRPSYDVTTMEEKTKFVVKSSPSSCFERVKNLQGLLGAVSGPGATSLNLVAGSDGEVGAVVKVGFTGVPNVSLRVEIRKLTPGKHIVLSQDVTKQSGEIVHSLIRWDFAPFQGDTEVCQATRIVTGATLKSQKEERVARLGLLILCMPCMLNSIDQHLVNEHNRYLNSIKAYLEGREVLSQGDL